MQIHCAYTLHLQLRYLKHAPMRDSDTAIVQAVYGITSCAGGRHNMPRPLLTLKVMSESCVTWATSANFSLPRHLCSRLRPDVQDRQTSDAHHRLMSPTLPYGRGHSDGQIKNAIRSRLNHLRQFSWTWPVRRLDLNERNSIGIRIHRRFYLRL